MRFFLGESGNVNASAKEMMSVSLMPGPWTSVDAYRASVFGKAF
jgi:hypothetical protein